MSVRSSGKQTGMRRLRSVGAAALLVATLLASCGQAVRGGVGNRGEGTSGLGACPPGTEFDAAPTGTLLGIGRAVWVEGSGIEELGSAPAVDDATLVRLRSPEVVGSGTEPKRDQMLVDPRDLETIEAAEGWTSIMASVSVGQDPHATLALVLPDGSVAFVGACAEAAATVPLARFTERWNERAGSSVSAAALLRSMLEDPAGEAAQLFQAVGPAEPHPWSDLPADERAVDPETTPPEVLQAMWPFRVDVRVPTIWSTFDLSICTRTSTGWNTCTALETSKGDRDLRMTGYAPPGEAVVIVALAGETWDSPQSVIGVLPAETLSDGAAVLASGDASVTSADGLLEATSERPAITIT